MSAPITRNLTLTLGLLGSVFSPQLLAQPPAQTPTENPETLEIASTSVSADGLGATTEDTGAYTTGSTSTATKLNLSIRETPQSISVVTRHPAIIRDFPASP